MKEALALIAARFLAPNPRPLPRRAGGADGGLDSVVPSFFSSLALPSFPSFSAFSLAVFLSGDAPFAPFSSPPVVLFGCDDGLASMAARFFDPLRCDLGGGENVFARGDELSAGCDF